MKISDRTSLGYLLTIIFSLYLMLFSFFSFIIFMGFISKGSIDYESYYIPCGPVFAIIYLIGIWLFNLYNASAVYDITRSKEIQNAYYFFIFYPSAILIMILAGLLELIQVIMIIGFPIFLVGAILLPLYSYVINREARAYLDKGNIELECYSCRYTFEIGRKEKEKECPLCGALNKNILALEVEIKSKSNTTNKI